MKHQITLTAFLFLIAPFSQAQSPGRPVASCGSAQVLSGDSCREAKVQFNLSACTGGEPRVPAARVVCGKKGLTARYQDASFRYEAKFDRVEDGWGSGTWAQVGPVARFEREAPRAAASLELVPAKETAKPESAPVVKPAEAAAPLFKFGAFGDFRYTVFSAPENPSVTNANAESGFGLEDGALYGSYEKDRLTVVADLSFRRQKDVDIDAAATTPNQSSNGNIALGVDKSQLFVKYRVSPVWSMTLGQFDTIYGVELNDSKDRFFGKTGLVYDATLPVTHTGVLVEAALNGSYAKILAANPNNRGSYGSSTARDDKTEYGAAVGHANDLWHGQVGYLSRSVLKASGSDFGSRTLLDVLFGMSLGSWAFDLEYNQTSDPRKDTLSTGDSSDLEKPGQGFLALVSYKYGEDLVLALRAEQLKDDPSASSIDTVSSAGLSVGYRVAPELQLRSEYISYDYKNLTGTTWKDSRFSLSTLFSF